MDKRGSKSKPLIKLFLKELKNNIKNGWKNLHLDVVLFIMYMKIKVVNVCHILEQQKSN